MKIIEKLNSLYDRSKLNKNYPIDRKLYALVCDKELLELAYDNIKSKPGNLTLGITSETLDGMSSEAIDQLVTQLKDESFQFKTVRRTQILKGSGGTRPITIAPLRDKIVQEAIRMVLHAVFEPHFADESHGFRPMRGCHTALKHVNQQFQSTV